MDTLQADLLEADLIPLRNGFIVKPRNHGTADFLARFIAAKKRCEGEMIFDCAGTEAEIRFHDLDTLRSLRVHVPDYETFERIAELDRNGRLFMKRNHDSYRFTYSGT